MAHPSTNSMQWAAHVDGLGEAIDFNECIDIGLPEFEAPSWNLHLLDSWTLPPGDSGAIFVAGHLIERGLPDDSAQAPGALT